MYILIWKISEKCVLLRIFLENVKELHSNQSSLWNFSPVQGACKVASNLPYSLHQSTEFEFSMSSVGNNLLGSSSDSN